MVHCWLSVTQHPLENRRMRKNTNLLNPQVASTDKYGNDFFFFHRLRLQVKCEQQRGVKKRKFVAKCETTDNRRMMNEWWGFLALPRSLILIKRFLVSRFCVYQFRIFKCEGSMSAVSSIYRLGGVRLVLQYNTTRHVKHIFMQMTNLSAFINKSNSAIWVSIYGARRM